MTLAKSGLQGAAGRVVAAHGLDPPPNNRRRCVGALAVLAAPAAAGAAVPSITSLSAGRSPVAGIQDDRIVVDANPDDRVRLLADAGAALIRVDMRWDLVAASRPVNPANPADPAYRWGQYDAIVAAARKYGVEVLFAVYGTPSWAQDTTVPFDSRYETWSIRPRDASDFGKFGEARSAALRAARREENGRGGTRRTSRCSCAPSTPGPPTGGCPRRRRSTAISSRSSTPV